MTKRVWLFVVLLLGSVAVYADQASPRDFLSTLAADHQPLVCVAISGTPSPMLMSVSCIGRSACTYSHSPDPPTPTTFSR